MATRKKQSQKPTTSSNTTKSSERTRNVKGTRNPKVKTQTKTAVKDSQIANSSKSNSSINSSQVNLKRNAKRSKRQLAKTESIIPAEQVEMDYSFDTDAMHNGSDVVEMMTERYVGLNVFFVLMVLMASAILWTGVKASMQIQQYREDYKTLQEMKHEYLQLQIEQKRLLIEQQTFSSTPQIATRAISKLNMFFPTFDDKRILQPQAKQTKQPSKTSQATPQNSRENKSQNHTANLSESSEVSQ